MVSEAARQLAAVLTGGGGAHSLSFFFSLHSFSLALFSTVEPITPTASIPSHEGAITCSLSPRLSSLKRFCGCFVAQGKRLKVWDWLICFFVHLGVCQHQITAKYSCSPRNVVNEQSPPSQCVQHLESKAYNFPRQYKSSKRVTAVTLCLLTLHVRKHQLKKWAFGPGDKNWIIIFFS